MRALRQAGLAGLVLAGVWVGLAFVQDGILHFAPLLVSAVVPLGRSLAALPAGRRALLGAGALGASLALAATAALALAGRLEGDSLFPAGGAATEGVAFSLAGAVVGSVLGMVRRRG